MITYVPGGLGQPVITRAADRCEYCLMTQLFTASAHPIDHIINKKHQSETVLENLALSCMICNLRKGTDIGSRHAVTKQLDPLFHRRKMHGVNTSIEWSINA